MRGEDHFKREFVLVKSEKGSSPHIFYQKDAGSFSWVYIPPTMPIKQLFAGTHEAAWLTELNRPLDRPYLKESAALEASHKALAQKSGRLKINFCNSKEDWENPKCIAAVSEFLEAAYAEQELFFRELAEATKGDSKKMVELLQCQRRKAGDPNFCYYYFYDSFTEWYHMARGCAYFDKNGDIVFPALTDKDQDPYFKEGPQSRWRELYNKFCDKLAFERQVNGWSLFNLVSA